jgi:3-methyladenine DNA glycosylase AlkD
MQQYMKSELPYHGVRMPIVRRTCARLFAEHPLDDREAWEDAIRTLWHEATHREERYAALALLSDRRYVAWRTPDVLPLVEELVVDGAWWDVVDWLAHVTRHVLVADREAVKPVLRAWSRDENLWKRRVAILAQLGLEGETDVGLLLDCIEPNLDDPAFFVRKAIGWALRDYAWHDAAWVAQTVAELGDRLSPLSRREATKNLGRLL